MEQLVTLLTFSFPHELAVVRSLLESEGIECFAKDEFTAQVNNFYSNAIGGIKLQVRESEFERAVEILKESNYFQEKTAEPEEFWMKPAGLIHDIPRLKKVMIILALVLLVMVTAVYYFTRPPLSTVLITSDFCIQGIIYKGEKLATHTTGFHYITPGSDDCGYLMNFQEQGTIRFPGINTYSIGAHWALDQNYVSISHADTLGHIFNGTYKLELSGEEFEMSSDSTWIYGQMIQRHVYY
jgi:hypothetical protein